MNLFEIVQKYEPKNLQEEQDKVQMLEFIKNNNDYLLRENKTGHFTTSAWAVNKERTKVLLVYHNIYDSWSWTGGHSDGEENLCKVALKELKEETGIKSAKSVSEDPISLEILSVNGHMKKGLWVLGHLHFNLTYLAEVDEDESLVVKEDENSAVQWWAFEDIEKASNEHWMVENVYKKLIERSR